MNESFTFALSWLENVDGYGASLAFGRVEFRRTFAEAAVSRAHLVAHPDLWLPEGGFDPVVSDVLKRMDGTPTRKDDPT